MDVITCGILPGKVELVNLLVDTHKSTLPGVWVRGSDRIAIYSSSRLEAKANERPAQLKRCSNRDIRLNIERRCARRKMMRHTSTIVYRRRSVTGGHAIILHSRHMEHQRSRGMFFRFGLLDRRRVMVRSCFVPR